MSGKLLLVSGLPHPPTQSHSPVWGGDPQVESCTPDHGVFVCGQCCVSASEAPETKAFPAQHGDPVDSRVPSLATSVAGPER